MIDTSKVIHAPVGGGRYTVTAPIVKEDYGLYLLIEGLELPSTYEVDFSNSEHNGTSVTMIGNADGVLIPSQFISSGKDVFAFLYHVGDNYGRTVFKFRIPNKLRPDRTDEQPTPEQESTIDQAINALNTAVAQTAQDVIDADASAQSASESAEQAQESARTAGLYSDTAQTYANSAEISANSASTSATASAQSAEQSAINSADAQDSAEEAQASASASAQSATASANSASQASASATSASQSATSAQGYVSSAQTSAQTASNKATEASGYASTASTKASESAQSASQALTYKTDAESAKTSAQTAQGLAESARDSAISAKDDAESARDEAQTLVDSISGKTEQIDQNTADIASLEDDIFKPYAVDSASGAIASFTDGADDIPLKSLVVNIDPVQDLSNGDPSPENICPISGWTGCKVGASGKNLLDESKLNDAQLIDCFVKNVDNPQRRKGIAIYLPSGTYSFTAWKKSVGVAYMYYNVVKNDGTFVRFEYLTTGADYTSVHTTLLDDEHILFFDQQANQEATQTKFGNYNLQLELGSTATPYEPYTGRSITIDLGQTVYGGKLDVLSGELTVYPYYASYNGETLTGEWISDRDVYAVGTTPTIGAQVVNIGAEGTEYQLDPHEIASLLGVNNIFADTGDTNVEYRADIKLYIEKLTQPEEDDMIADSAITSGQFFMVGNTLYRALANIASGATITVGTNAERVSLSDALNLVNT